MEPNLLPVPLDPSDLNVTTWGEPQFRQDWLNQLISAHQVLEVQVQQFLAENKSLQSQVAYHQETSAGMKRHASFAVGLLCSRPIPWSLSHPFCDLKDVVGTDSTSGSSLFNATFCS